MFFTKLFIIFIFLKFSAENAVEENIFFNRLNKLLDYCIFNPTFIDEQLTFGIIITNAQLRKVEKNCEVEKLMKKCDMVIKNFEERKENRKNSSPLKFLNSSQFELNFPLIYHNFNAKLNKISSVENYLDLIYNAKNQPDGKNSDACLREIFEQNCQISTKCKLLENTEIRSYGYQNTHK
ncbi:hypothetical protein PVAND_015599 [Polypedilum vanderplanki]|uniref:Venom protein n=1 Tax=Polypedilum vanderplanki TaxID=319348 RepID=A0A9J6BCN1_POLVA|nr:hypothetical protein PVAND_015599 [Polypedilum vanderplanki]